MLKIKIIPIFKKKGLRCNESNSYRQIAIATTASKIVEHLILQKYSSELKVGAWQYGYKKSLGTKKGIFGLRCIVNHFNNNGSKVFCSFLDASKAFDNVMHEKLCLKLLDKNILVSVVRLFLRWCKTQRFCI